MSEPVAYERLMAYADGEVDAAEAAAIEAALAADPALARQLARLREQDALLRSAFNPFLHEPAPPGPAQAIQAAGRSRHDRWRMPAAIAASVAGLMLAVGVGWFAADYRGEERLAALKAEQEVLQEIVSAALETHLSGEAVSWQDPKSGLQASVTPLRTFRAQSGQWCREYHRTLASDGALQERRAVACREGDGAWRDRIEIVNAS